MYDKADMFLIFDADMRFYLTGQKVSFGCVVLTKKANFYISDSRYETALREALQNFEIIIVKRDGLFPAIGELAKRLDAASAGIEDESLTYRDYLGLKAALGKKVAFVKSGKDLNGMRAIKTKQELDKIYAAQKITERAFEAGIDRLKAGITEREIAAVIIYEMLKGGADDYSFFPIVSFGANSAKPHHSPDDTRLEKGNLVMIDLGAKYRGYCADMTRTVFYGEPSKDFIKIYDIVLGAQLSALRAIRANITCHEADSYAREYIRANGYEKEFGHGTGHGVGVKIHEEPNLAPGNQERLRPGMVVTVEPGIYLPGLGGVRIEDLVVITETNVSNMTTAKKELTILK